MGAVAGIGFLAVNRREERRREANVQSAQEQAARVEAAQRANEARKSRREQIREARIRQSQVANESASTGQTGSSAAIAAGDSLQGRLGTNVGSINTAVAFGSAKSNAEQAIYDANRKSNLEMLSGVGMNIAFNSL